MTKKKRTGRCIASGAVGILAAVILVLTGCTAGPITYEQATEFHETIAGLEQRLAEVESMLMTARQDGDLNSDVEQTLSRATDEVVEVASSLEELRVAF